MNDFVLEATSSLALVDQHLIEFEHKVEPEAVNDVFRAIHSIKGVAGFLGLDQIQALSHEMESALDKVRRGELVINSQYIDVILRSNDLLRQMVENPSQTFSMDAELEALVEIQRVSTEKEESLEVASRVDDALLAAEKALAEEPSSGVTIAPQSGKAEVQRVKDAIRAAFASNSSEEIAPERSELKASKDDQTKDKNQAAAVDGEGGGKTTADAPIPSLSGSLGKTAGGALPKREPESTNAHIQGTNKSVADSSIRVPVAVLEELVNLAGELVLSRNQLVRTIDEYKLKSLAAIGSRIDQVTTAMQDAIMHARMQQVGLLFSRFPRLLRDLNQKLSKRCKLVVEGADVELDKTVLEALADPLTHLIRNSLDHGIEAADVRRKSGKCEEGTLQLKAFHEGGKVRIIVEDDGQGINRERVVRKALEKGLISHEESLRLTDRETLHMIFRPGFSTAEAVSDVSGRGVGMDVVRTNIERIGGTVEIESQYGKGTSIQITLPLTLAIVPSWVVCQDEFQFAIPEANVIEFLSLSQEDVDERIHRLEGSELIRWRGGLLPLVRLRDCLPQERGIERASQRLNKIVVIETGSFRFGLAVEQVCDPEHVVVKPISSHLGQSGYLDGAAVLGDGNVAFILGMQGIAERARLAEQNIASSEEEGDMDTLRNEVQAAIVVRRQNGQLAAIPRMVIQRIERVDPRSIQFASQRWIVPYRGGQLQVLEWERNSIKSLLRNGAEFCYIMVYLVREMEVGFLVKDIVDIRDIPTAVSFGEGIHRAVVGTVLLDDQVVELLDLFEYADCELGLKKPSPAVTQGCPAAVSNSIRVDSESQFGIPGLIRKDWSRFTILLAEDTPFFREQVKGFLEQVPFRVVVAKDGQDAWEILNQDGMHIDLLLTDIEMPRLDGYQLAIKIRSCARLQGLPIIAITSLHTDAAQRKGREVGINEWQIKLDRDKLIHCLQEKLNCIPSLSTSKN